MKIGMIGAGNLASHLAPALQAAGHEIVAVYSRTQASADALAAKVGAPAWVSVEQLPEADVYIFSVRDDALQMLADEFCPRHSEALFLHTAGSMPMAVFEAVARRYGVLYPMQTFSKSRAVDFRCIPCFVEGCTPEVCAEVEALAAQISDTVMPLDSDKRRALHLAAVFACNFANHCYAEAARLVEGVGIPFSTFLPLIDETAAKVHELSPVQAQTGPAVRFDRKVMQRQLELLGDPGAKRIYEAMSEQIHAFATSSQNVADKQS